LGNLSEGMGVLVRGAGSGYVPVMKKEEKKVSSFEDNPLAQAILREGLKIQDRFSAEPVYARTGKGYLKSEGVAELDAIKKAEAVKRK
jgi:protein-L-isoaspartate O-methyltransferase